MAETNLSYEAIATKLIKANVLKYWQNFAKAVYDYLEKEWLVEGYNKPNIIQISESARHVFYNNKSIKYVMSVLSDKETTFLIVNFIHILDKQFNEKINNN